MASPVVIAVTKVRCLIETDEVGSDEPYILVTGINLKTPIPNVEVTRYGPWADVDEADLLVTQPIPAGFNPDSVPFIIWRRPCWGLNGKPAAINHPDDVIFLVSLMEHDDGDPSAAQILVKSAAVASLAASMGMSRADRVAKLIKDINGALKIPTGAPNFDDRVGSTQELRLSQTLLQVEDGVKAKNLVFTGDGGQYRIRFEVSKG
ncbi:MAG TPA: hypothetical protein VFZ66_09865 [Herpetosiphonaceae bacterium]